MVFKREWESSHNLVPETLSFHVEKGGIHVDRNLECPRNICEKDEGRGSTDDHIMSCKKMRKAGTNVVCLSTFQLLHKRWLLQKNRFYEANETSECPKGIEIHLEETLPLRGPQQGTDVTECRIVGINTSVNDK